MRKGPSQLISYAMMDLRKLGYTSNYNATKVGTCKNVRAFSKDGEDYNVFIQTRSEDSKSRYTVGIVLEALRKCDYHIAWFENESNMFMIPCKRLLEIWKETVEFGEPCYSGKDDRQWRVDYYPCRHILTPQDTDRHNKKRYYINEYAIKAPQVWKQRIQG